MFHEYYQSELAYLREMGREFAKKHPGLAGMLAERGVDPDVERLLEGFAFVAARIHQRIDDSAPELAEALAELMLPHTLRPTPAASVLELRVQRAALRGRCLIDKGYEVRSQPIGGTGKPETATPCRFATTRALELAPVRLVRSRLDESFASSPELILSFEADEPGEPAVFSQRGLQLHLHGDLASASQLYLWLSRYVESVSLRGAGGQSFALGASAVRPLGFEADDTLLPWPAFSPHSSRLMLEYLNFPAKFLFFEVVGIEPGRQLRSAEFELAIRFSRPPPLAARLPDDAVRLHCVPVVNLFNVGAEPTTVGLDERPSLLRAAGVEPNHMEVFEVTSVVGTGERQGRRTYHPFHGYRHGAGGERVAGFYKLRRKRSPVDDGHHVFLQLLRSPELAARLTRETLSIDLLCTNRSLALELRVGDLSVPESARVKGVEVTNIRPISPPVRPALGESAMWRQFVQLGCSRRSLGELEVLKTLLSLQAAQAPLDHPSMRANQARVDALRSLSMSTIARFIDRAAVCGTKYLLELAEEGFTSIGDAYLFGCVIHQLLANDARVNTFADLRCRLTPSERSFEFETKLS